MFTKQQLYRLICFMITTSIQSGPNHYSRQRWAPQAIELQRKVLAHMADVEQQTVKQAQKQRLEELEKDECFRNAFNVAFLGFLVTQQMSPEDRKNLLLGIELTIKRLQAESSSK